MVRSPKPNASRRHRRRGSTESRRHIYVMLCQCVNIMCQLCEEFDLNQSSNEWSRSKGGGFWVDD